MAVDTPSVVLPIPISFIPPSTYLIFSAQAATYLRRQHSIPGVLTGSLPQIPQQNVFLGLPLQLMPEEAKVLVDEGVAYVIDDVQRHSQTQDRVEEGDRQRYLEELKRQGGEAARMQAGRKEQKREVALRKLAAKNNNASSSSNATPKQKEGSESGDTTPTSNSTPIHGENDNDDTDSLFRPPTPSSSSSSRAPSSPPPSPRSQISSLAVTPSSSDLLIPPAPSPPTCPAHKIHVPKSYPLFAHLHTKAYFISPGLRFGCQYMVYPGDPLRFHSHFLANGYGWDEEIDLMEIVGGGRLGTGVKKGFLIGGEESARLGQGQGERDDSEKGGSGGRVRMWSIEWAGM